MWTRTERSRSDNEEAKRRARRLGASLSQDVQQDVRRSIAELEEQAASCDGAQAAAMLRACEQASLRLQTLVKALDAFP